MDQDHHLPILNEDRGRKDGMVSQAIPGDKEPLCVEDLHFPDGREGQMATSNTCHQFTGCSDSHPVQFKCSVEH